MPQFARPSSDITVTGWTTDTGGTTNLWAAIDEATPFSDADYVKSPTPPGTNEYETKLSAVTDPNASTGHVMRWRRRKQPTGSAQINLTVRLLQGTTQITSQADNDLGTSFADTSYTLSAAEADSITDYSDLRLEFVAAQV